MGTGCRHSWAKNISIQIILEECLDIPDSLLDILQGTQSPCHSTIVKGLLLELGPKVHLGGTNRVRLEGKKAINPVRDMLGVMVDHK